MMIKTATLCLLFALQCNWAFAQAYPKNYFRHPLNIKMELVANMGEIRTNHWHMGLDIRTQQRVNLPVFAAADGYIARVVVEPGGFGQAIYINHPNGLTTLYAHLNAFFPELNRYILKKQYELESWRIDEELPPGLFAVKKGAQIALSGSTGGSQGPHVHFEIRDTKTSKVLNPLLFNFPIADAVPPSIIRLAMYDRNISTYKQKPQLIGIKNFGKSYGLTTGNMLKVGSNKISFAVGAVDRLSSSHNPIGIYCAEVSLDGNPVSDFVIDSVDYNESRYINAQLDYPYKARGGANLQHITPLPGATGVVYHTYSQGGIIYLPDSSVHQVKISVWDANNNVSTLNFKVQYSPALSRNYETSGGEQLLPNNVNIFERPGFELFTTEATIYDTAVITYNSSAAAVKNAVSELHQFLNNTIPVHDYVTVKVLPTATVPEAQRERIIIKNVAGNKVYVQKATWQKGWLSATFRQLGSFQAFIDDEPPTVNTPPSDLSRATRIVFTPHDNFNSIKNFRVTLNGKWLRFTNDKGRSWIYRFDEHFPRGQHQLQVVVEDEAGNVTTKTWTVKR